MNYMSNTLKILSFGMPMGLVVAYISAGNV